MNAPSDAVRDQLERVLASRQFQSSELQQRFLSFVVEKTLNGSADEIKEYTIGAEAFRRGKEFDPRVDSVVRVVARRVRERLDEYYRTDGQNDPVLILLAKGGYVPSFETRAETTEARPAAAPQESAQPSQNPSTPDVLPALFPQRITVRKWIGLGLLAAIPIGVAVYFLVRPASPPKIVKYTQLTDDGQGKLGVFAVGAPAPLVTDGARVYFAEVAGAQVVISQVSTAGGQTVPLRRDLTEPLVVMDISPDRSELLATEFFRTAPDAQLQILPLPGGEPHPVGNLKGHDGAWSPDGERICYANGNRLYVARKSGADSKLLASLPGLPSWPRWSPDGSKLRFTLEDVKGNTSLWEISASGAGLRPLLPGWNDDHPAECCGDWSPDGKYFVFQSTRQGNTALWAVRERSWPFGPSPAAPFRLTEGPVNVWSPVFSPDGRRIFAVVQQRRGELVRYDSSLQRFTTYLGGISADHVEFSRDLEWIAYSDYPEQTIWKSRADGSERMQLSFSPMTAIFPRWSPDGNRIAFMGSVPGRPVEIYIVSASGGAPEQMLPGDSPQIDPNWSPDGNSLMFASLPAAVNMSSGQPVIRIFNLKTRQVTTVPDSNGLTSPRWSPDGRFVVATALSQGKWADPAVRIYDFRTGKWSDFESDPIDNKWWSKDGQYFYFDKLMSNDPAIYRIRLSDRQIERVATYKNVRRSLNEMGWWMGIAPDGSPMVLRDTSIEEIYALDFSGR